MPIKDIEKRRAAIRRHYYSHKEQYAAKNNRKAERLRQFITDFKTGKPCMDCGNLYPPYVMDFDHRGDEEKYDNVSHLTRSSLRRVKEEIAKCDLVCSNCHRERTHQRRVSSAEEP